MKRHNGIALIQILLITGVLSVLVLYLSQTARQQISIAIDSQDRAKALVENHNGYSRVLFDLLTRQKLKGYRTDDSAEPLQWNFFGYPFEITPNVTATIQDQSGLLNVQFLNCSELSRILTFWEMPDDQVNDVCNAIIDWQDLDTEGRDFRNEGQRFGGIARNGKMPYLDDLHHLGLDDELVANLKGIMTVHYVGRFNPMTAPDVVLEGWLASSSAFSAIQQARQNGQLTKQEFTDLSLIKEDEDIWLTPSNFIELNVSTQVGNISLSRRWVLHIRPYAQYSSPVNILENRG